MSQRIVTFCDAHQSRDEDVPGVRYDFALRSNGDRFVFVTVDLCKDCAKPLADLAAELTEVGREFDGEVPGAKTYTGRKRGPKPLPETEENRTCPDCGFVSASRKASTAHRRTQHGKSSGGEFICPDCKDGFVNPQGLAAHRRAAHP